MKYKMPRKEVAKILEQMCNDIWDLGQAISDMAPNEVATNLEDMNFAIDSLVEQLLEEKK